MILSTRRLKSKLGPVWEQMSFISSLRDSLVTSGKTEAQVHKAKMARVPIGSHQVGQAIILAKEVGKLVSNSFSSIQSTERCEI